MKSFSKHFRESFLLRHHMALILIGSAAAGILASRYLLHFGVHMVWQRLPLTVIISYAAFFALLRLWLAYVSAYYSPQPHYPEDGEELTSDKNAKSRSDGDGGSDWGFDGLGDLPSDEGGCLLVFILLFSILLIGAAALLIMEAPVILAEAAFQFFLGVGLIKSFRCIDHPGWSGSIIRATWKPFLWVFVIACVVGGLAQLLCPGAISLRAAYSCAADKK